MGTVIIELKRVASEERIARMWNRIVSRQAEPVRSLITHVYYRVLDHYLDYCTATQLATINRPLNTRLKRVMSEMGLPNIPMVELLRGARDSGLPFLIHANPTGGQYVLPAALEVMYGRLMYRNDLIKEGTFNKPDALVEALEPWEDICIGLANGPELRSQSLIRAQSPFAEPPAVGAAVPVNVSDTDQKFGEIDFSQLD